MTASPASSDPARSTSAENPQSWSPAGSSKICRTRQRSLSVSSMISIAGPRASAFVPISPCSAKYGSRAPAQASASQPASGARGRALAPCPALARGVGRVGVGEPLPLVEQAGVDLPDHLAQPLDQVGQLLGLGLVGHGLAPRLVGVGEG